MRPAKRRARGARPLWIFVRPNQRGSTKLRYRGKPLRVKARLVLTAGGEKWKLNKRVALTLRPARR